MGANCCVAARDKPLLNRLSSEVSNYRNIRHSPSWSFRWDNRTHIEDIMDNPSRFSHHNNGNIGSEDQSPRSNLSAEEKCSFKSSSPANYTIAKTPVSVPSALFNPTHLHLKKARSHGGSSDGWSMRTFPSQRERWSSFDSGNPNSQLIRSSSPHSCSVCSKLLMDKSPWSAQKIVSTNELSVTAVLACGHVYHAECLESVASEIDRYDPPCPVCTNGDKLIPKMRAKSKISRRPVADIDVDLKWDGKSPSVSVSSSMKKPFLKRHFSVGSRSVSDSEAMRKKRRFWGKLHRD